jgi:hypothetical protein
LTRHCWRHASYSTTLLRLGRHPRRQRSGVATSINSSSLPSTCRSMRGGANHLHSILTPRQRHMRRPQPVRRLSSTLLPSGQMPTKQCGIVHRWRVTQRPTSGLKSTVAAVEKMAESPSSASARGIEISRAAILKKISTLTRRRIRVHPNVRHIPLAPRELRGGAWRWHHICGWWSGHASAGPTCQRSMMEPSTPLSSCRSTPPLSLRQGG